MLQQDRQLVDQPQIARVGQGDFEGAVLRLNRHKIVPEHQVDRNGMEQVMIDADFAKVDEFVIITFGDSLGPRRFLDGIYREKSFRRRHNPPGDTPVLKELDAF